MSVQLDKDFSSKKFRYIITHVSFLLKGNKELKIDPRDVLELSIEEDFEQNFFPLFRIVFSVNSVLKNQLVRNKNDVRVSLRIDKVYKKAEREYSTPKLFLNSIFNVIDDIATEDILNDIKKSKDKKNYSKKKSEKDEKTLTPDSFNVIEYYLFNKEQLTGIKANVNAVLTNSNVADAVAYMLQNANFKKVLMKSPDNTNIYKELLIPPMNVLKGLQYVDTYYGIFKKGTVMYFGLKYNYIIPFSGDCEVNRKNEKKITNFIVPKIISSLNEWDKHLGSLYKKGDKTNHYILCDPEQLEIYDLKDSNKFISAEEITLIDNYAEVANQAGKDISQFYVNNTENPLLPTMFSNLMKSSSKRFNLGINDYDIDVITPNKKINIIFEDSAYTKKYDGKYILSSVVHKFNKSRDGNGKFFEVMGDVTLKKE